MLWQVLQTLYILIQNIRSQTAIYYIFSNNHVNDIVTLRFDFEDDEVLGYYINLLKTISLRLTSKTVQFFFQVHLTGLCIVVRGRQERILARHSCEVTPCVHVCISCQSNNSKFEVAIKGTGYQSACHF